MIAKNKINFFQETILQWFAINEREFRWRNPAITEYQIVISEVLLQRTKAETVSKFYDRFLIDFPDWHSLAHADLNKIENYLIPIGLFRQRAKRLQNLAKYMVENGSHFPNDRTLLEKIPFMGQYIANAVELLIHKKNSPLLDVNMARVLERYFGPRKLSDIRYDPYLQKLAYRIVNHSQSKEINWGIIDFAALICKSHTPLCSKCSLSINCKYFIQFANKFVT